MSDSIKALYGTLSRATKRRLRFAALGLVVVGGLEMLGLVLVLPLMQMFAGSPTDTGVLGRISDFLGNPSDSTLALTMAGVVFAAFVTKGVFTLAFRWWVLGFTNRQAADAGIDLFERYLNAPYAFHLKRNTSEMMRTMGDAVNQAYLTVVNSVLNITSEVATVVAVALVLLVVRPLPALAAILYFGVVGFLFLRFVRRKAQQAGTDMVESTREVIQASLQGLGGIKEVQVRGVQDHFASQYRDARHRSAMAMRMSLYLGESPRYALEMLFIVGVALMSAVVFVGGDAKQGAATLGLFVAAGFRLLPSMVRILASASALRVGERGLQLVLTDLNDVPRPEPIDVDVAPLQLHTGINIDALEFRYPDADHNVLDGVSLDVAVGKSLAIVGSSGAGKTTLVDIVLGLHDPTGGHIRIDGVDLAAVKPQWQRAIGLVPQDVYLLDDSLRANIAFGEEPEKLSEERLTEAINRAQLNEMVQDLPEGLDTFVGERGVRLSGGQRQRIGIARALYLRPQLLVLDEATSSLDNETERRITSTIEALRGELTMIVVAHRLSTVRRCDQLIFMRDGKIESIGTFDEVRAANETFAGLVELGSLASLDEPEVVDEQPAPVVPSP